MTANVVVLVYTSMSAAASTPVYLAMTGAAARSVPCRGGLSPQPRRSPRSACSTASGRRRSALFRAGFEAGDVGLVHSEVIAGGEVAQGVRR